MPKNKPKIIVIVGPTASGKSDLAVLLAMKFNGEIVSADSRQVYKGMDIGSGKITKKEMKGITHHLLDVASPKRTFTVSQYQKLGKKAVGHILKNRKVPIIVGGTGFYIDSLVNDQVFPDVKPDHRLRKRLDKLTAEHLYNMLRKHDPIRAQNIDRFNKRRLVRALEIISKTRKPITPIASGSNYRILTIGIKIPQNILKERIKTRMLKRFRQKMIDEVRKLHKQGVSWQRLDKFGLEYRWISRHLRGLVSKAEMQERLEREIRHYAKRQMTWFKRGKDTIWITNPKQAYNRVKSYLLEK